MSDLIEKFPVVRPVRDAADFARLEAEALRDNHYVFQPSHVVEKGGEVAGYLGICSLPLLRVWLHTERMKARDTAMVMAIAENLMRANGVQMAAGMIARNSKLFGHLPRLGWTPVAETFLAVKNLAKG